MNEPAWLTAAIDQRIALIEHAITAGAPLEAALVMTPLTEPPEGASEADYIKWDRSCDNCGAFCPPPADFYTGHAQRNLRNGQLVFISFGVCKTCKSSL